MSQDKSINERIKKLRLEKGFSQEKMGELLGIKTSTYSQMERNGIISAQRLKILAEIFDVSYEFLLDGKKELVPPSYQGSNPSNEEICKIIKEQLDNRYQSRYSFLDGYTDVEIRKLKLLSCLTKKQRDSVFEFAYQVFSKKIKI